MTPAKVKKSINAFSEVVASLELPLLRVYILAHLFWSLFHH